ncbi:MAG: type III pantothenate kinase [Xanthomonadales bacterium]|nr:type III pantothenate kinase [Xanthomonadales bacterium]
MALTGPRRLLLDQGNTRLKWVLSGPQGWLHAPRAITAAGPTLLARWQRAALDQVVVASVAPAAAQRRLRATLARLSPALPVRWAAPTASWRGLRCGYPSPDRLGVDRWLALVAAWRERPGRCVVVSAGTALTLDRLEADGRHAGGLIVPGLAAMQAGLFAAAPGLRRHRGGVADAGLATDSPEAIASGCLQALLALVERWREPGDAVFLAGGDASALAPGLAEPLRLRPWLVLEGLDAWSGDTPAAG